MGQGVMASDSNKDNFSISGPFHLTCVDWSNWYHRTSVASSLVSGVYKLEGDRLEEREGSESLAKPWWEFFDFTLLEPLIDDDGSIYGAIFEYDLYQCYQDAPHVKAPRYVIAFRGTVLKEKTWKFDAKLNLKIILNTLHQGSRSINAVKEVRSMVEKHSESAIWLAGHSLGAALVLLAGKTMASSGFLLDSYVFNPPISCIALEQLPGGHMIKEAFQIGKSLVKAAVYKALTDVQDEQDDPNLALWIPYLYVNPADPLCAGFINYFKHKTVMAIIGASKFERISARKSVRSFLLGRKGESSTSDLSKEPLHLLPSADMTVNKNTSSPHGLHQWWVKDSAMGGIWERYRVGPYTESNMEQLE